MKHYEAPAVQDFGTVESITLGELRVSSADFPLGTPILSPVG